MSNLAKHGLKILREHKSSHRGEEPKDPHKNEPPILDKRTHQVEHDRHRKVKTQRSDKDKDIKYYTSLGISAADAKRLGKVKSLALKFDGRRGFKITDIARPGTLIEKLGWIGVIALVFPAIGDFIDLPLALFLVLRASRISSGLGLWTTIRMLLNVAIEFGIDLTPYIGPLVGLFFRSNLKNSALLEKKLIKQAQKARSQQKEQRLQHDDYELASYDNAPPGRSASHESDHMRSGSSHTHNRHHHQQEQPVRSKSYGWRDGPGNLIGRKKSSTSRDRTPKSPRRPKHHDDVRSQGGRFITARDL